MTNISMYNFLSYTFMKKTKQQSSVCVFQDELKTQKRCSFIKHFDEIMSVFVLYMSVFPYKERLVWIVDNSWRIVDNK